MPAFTLGDICSRATTLIGRRSDIALSDATFWANVAIQDVARESEQALLERLTVSSTTSGENRMDLPSDFYTPIVFSYLTDAGGAGSARTLTRWSETEVDSRGFLPGARPSHFVLYENYVELWPSPNSAYSLQLRYKAYPSDLSQVAEVPSLDTEFRLAALYKLEHYLHRHVGNAMEAAEADIRYFNYMSSLKDARAKRQSGQGKFAVSLPLRKSRY